MSPESLAYEESVDQALASELMRHAEKKQIEPTGDFERPVDWYIGPDDWRWGDVEGNPCELCVRGYVDTEANTYTVIYMIAWYETEEERIPKSFTAWSFKRQQNDLDTPIVCSRIPMTENPEEPARKMVQADVKILQSFVEGLED